MNPFPCAFVAFARNRSRFGVLPACDGTGLVPLGGSQIHSVLVNSPYTNVVTVDIELEDGNVSVFRGFPGSIEGDLGCCMECASMVAPASVARRPRQPFGEWL